MQDGAMQTCAYMKGYALLKYRVTEFRKWNEKNTNIHGHGWQERSVVLEKSPLLYKVWIESYYTQDGVVECTSVYCILVDNRYDMMESNTDASDMVWEPPYDVVDNAM